MQQITAARGAALLTTLLTTLFLGSTMPASALRAPAPLPPDAALGRLAERAAQTGGADLRACDATLSRRGRRIDRATFRFRATRGGVRVNTEGVGGRMAYRQCLENVFQQHIVRASRDMRIRIPGRTSTMRLEVNIPRAGAGGGAPVVVTPPGPQQPPAPPQGSGYVQVPGTNASYAPVFREQNRFTLSNVNLGGQGAVLHMQTGGVVQGSATLQHHCAQCGGAINQVIIGIGGQNDAQQCVYNGGAQSGAQQVNFRIRVPNQPGVYEVRARYAQAYDCRRGLGWWRVDRPNGPGPRSTIGVIIVEAPQQSMHSLIENGSFEEPRLRPRAWRGFASIPGWQRSMGRTIEVQHGAAGAPVHGNQLVELDGQDATGIFQDVRLQPGQRYALRVAFSARPGRAHSDNIVDVYVDGRLVGRLEADGTGRARTQWSYSTFFFRARSGRVRVEFRYAGTSNGYGGYIDDVTLLPAQ